MYFCPKCNYSFDITKSSNSQDTRKHLDTVSSAFELLKDKGNLSNYIAKFSKEELEKDNKYKKLSSNNKKKLNKLFDNPILSNVIFKCLNCNFTKNINETIRLYQLNLKDDETVYASIENNKLIMLNPILPRTKDYTCKNINCITHKDDTNKEAVYYKNKDNYNVTYICSVCFNSWDI